MYYLNMDSYWTYSKSAEEFFPTTIKAADGSLRWSDVPENLVPSDIVEAFIEKGLVPASQMEFQTAAQNEKNAKYLRDRAAFEAAMSPEERAEAEAEMGYERRAAFGSDND